MRRREDVEGGIYVPKSNRDLKIPYSFDVDTSKYIKDDEGKKLKVYMITGIFLSLLLFFVIQFVKNWIGRIILFSSLTYIYVFILRKFVFKEEDISKSYETLKYNDYKMKNAVLWSIYDINTVGIPIVRFLDGSKGIFVKFHKDVRIGKGDNIRYEHYDGIAEMLRVLHNNNLSAIMIDYMEPVSFDERHEMLYKSIENSEAVVLKQQVEKIYTNLRKVTSTAPILSDVYLIYGKVLDSELLEGVDRVITASEFTNYSTPQIFKENEIRQLVETLLNLTSFSVKQAQRDIVTDIQSRNIKLIYSYDSNEDVLEKHNKYTWEVKRTSIFSDIKKKNESEDFVVSESKKDNKESNSKNDEENELLDLF